MNLRSQIAPALAVLALSTSLSFVLEPPPITDLAHFFVVQFPWDSRDR